jgi:hypothetical protein
MEIEKAFNIFHIQQQFNFSVACTAESLVLRIE